MTVRSDRRLTTRLRQAKLRLSASLEDIDYRHPRGLDKALLLRLASCQWIHDRHNVLITGPTGCGKTWLSCALGHQACREGYTVLSLRLPRLLQELPIAKGEGRYPKLMAALAKTALLILDDWGLAALSDENRRDVLELLEDRHGRGATMVTSQFPVEHWHEALGNPTLADAILDRLLHNAYKITPTVSPAKNALVYFISKIYVDHQGWRRHREEAKRGLPSGHRLTRNEGAMMALLLP